jgi:hypothetical protein
MNGNLSNVTDYLDQIKIPIRIGCVSESGWPVVLSLWFIHRNGKLYCATKESARIVKYLRTNPKCAFEIAADTQPYCGVRGQAIASIEKSLGPEILKELIIRYLGGIDNKLARKLLNEIDAEVAIVLKPVNNFNWNFTSRMKGISPEMGEFTVKICPD